MTKIAELAESLISQNELLQRSQTLLEQLADAIVEADPNSTTLATLHAEHEALESSMSRYVESYLSIIGELERAETLLAENA